MAVGSPNSLNQRPHHRTSQNAAIRQPWSFEKLNPNQSVLALSARAKIPDLPGLLFTGTLSLEATVLRLRLHTPDGLTPRSEIAAQVCNMFPADDPRLRPILRNEWR